VAQEHGLDGYPVFTRKCNTDVSYLACAKALLAAPDAFYPQFATHNAQSLAAVIELAGSDGNFEFQRLHGMGEADAGHGFARPRRLSHRARPRCQAHAGGGGREAGDLA
jgi:hypothetical protein